MNASPRRNSMAQVPWGLIGTIVLVAVIERAGFANNAAFQSIHAANWNYAGRPGMKKAVDRQILCFGDSQMKFGVLPRVLKAMTGKSAFNLAMTVGPSPASYFVLRRAIEAGARPSAVIVDFNSGIQKEGPSSRILPYPWGDLLGLREAIELASVAGDGELLGRIVVARLFPSCRSRHEIRAHLLSCLRGQREDNSVSLLVSRLNWNRNDGAQAHFKSTFKDLPPPPPGPHQEGRWSCDPVNEHYIHRFLKLADEHKIPVYWLIAPLCPSAQAHLEYRGDDEQYTRFVARIQSSYPNLVVIDGRRPGLDRSFFFDDRHLDRDGAMALTAGISKVITRHDSPGGSTTRWETLSEVQDPPFAVAIEDVGMSLSDLRSMAAKRRR